VRRFCGPPCRVAAGNSRRATTRAGRTNGITNPHASEPSGLASSPTLPNMLIPEEAAPQFLDDAAPRNGMMPPPDSEMISPPITE